MPIAIAAVVYAIVLFTPQVLNDGDTWFHIAAGRWILQHHAAPWTDPFSLTLSGAPWRAQEWLSELAMAIAFKLDGLSGVLILTAAAAALCVALLARHLRFWLAPLPAFVVLIFGLGCVAPDLLARPHILALPVLELWTAGLLMARTRNRAPSLWLLPVMALWANLHGSFAFGIALVVPLGLEAMLADRAARWGTSRAWGLFLLAAIAAAMLTPYGWHSLAFPFQLLGQPYLGLVKEWGSMDFSKPQPLEIALMALLYVGFSRGVRIPPIRLLIMLGLLYMALQHARHGMLAGIVGALLFAEPLAQALRRQPVGSDTVPPRASRAEAVCTLAGAGLLVVLTVLRMAYAAVPQDRATSPVSALRHVPVELKTQPVFNDYGFGGLLIFDGIRPFIDSRAELYGDELLGLYVDVVRPNPVALEATFRRYGITWTILKPDSPVVAVLDALPGWRRAHSDGFAVVHIRTEPAH